MYLQRLLQINVATLAALGTLLLGMGTRDVELPLLMLIASITSVGLTDFSGWFRLNRTLANIAALVAVVLSLRELPYFGGDAQILGIAKLLIYLQIILLFQEKDDRAYTHLIMLSLLQVVIAAVFSQGVWFGVLLVVYMLVGFSGLALLFLHRQWNRYRPAGRLSPAPPAAGRWPLAGQEPVFSSAPAGRAGVGRELFGRLGLWGLGTLLLTLLLFFIVPRFGHTAWRGAVLAPKRVVGFSEEVTLGELGRIIESREEVMRLRLTDEDTGQDYRVQGELYLRGAVLTHYQGGRWAYRPPRAKRGTAAPLSDQASQHLDGSFGRKPSPVSPPSNRPLVRQKITIEPLDREELFCIWPFVRLEPDVNVKFDSRLERLKRPKGLRRERFSYELGTTALVDGVQVPLVPCQEPLDTKPLMQLPELPQLTKLAERWIAESGLPAEDRIAQARELERQFHNPDRFQYSLEGPIRDWNIDPVEDFVSNNPRGHCEYFATALALMLRSRGIPSRVVVGYRCDEFNEPGNFYQVRQMHAHTWVEAYLEPQHVPPGLFHGPRLWRPPAGGWLRLEPTPASSATGAGGSIAERVEQAFHWLQSLWANYVMEMDRDRQRNAWRHLRDPDWWRGLLQKIGEALKINQLGVAGGRWLWVALTILLGLPVLVFVGRRLWRARWKLWLRLVARADSAVGSGRAEVEFYRRLELLLARHGLVRPAGQTQREFAAAAGAKLAVVTGQTELASLPLRVVEAFYRVRFGRLPLDSPRAEAVEHALSELAACGLEQRAMVGGGSDRD